MIFSEEELLFPEKFTYYRLNDNSMMPDIPYGATLTIRNVETNEDVEKVDPRKLYYICINSLEKRIRYMIKLKDKVILLANNRSYPAEVYDLTENLISILGVVEACYCDFKS